MKYLKFIFSGTFIATLIAAVFVPMVTINNEYLSSFLLVFSNNCNVYSLILFFGILLGIGGGVLLIFEDKSPKFAYASLIVSLLAAITIFLVKDILAGGLGDTDVIEATDATIIFGIITALYCVYTLTYVFKNNQFSVKDMVESAMLIGLAVLLDISFFKIRLVSSGGSISFVMVPLIILALRQGFVKGFISCGIIFGFTTCLLDGYGFFTFPFDYLMGFGALAIVGLFKYIILPKDSKKITIKGVIFLTVSILVACFGRFIASTISGVVFYGTTLVESMAYQALYIPASAGVSLAVVLLLYKPLLVINTIFPPLDLA